MWCAIDGEDLLVFVLHLGNVACGIGFEQNLQAGFVQVVAPTPAVVDAHHGFQIVHDLAPWQKRPQFAGNDGRAPHATACHDAKAQFARIVFYQIQAHIVPGCGGAVFGRPGDGDFEFAWQVGKLGVQRAPLAQNFGKRARVGNFIGRNAC